MLKLSSSATSTPIWTLPGVVIHHFVNWKWAAAGCEMKVSSSWLRAAPKVSWQWKCWGGAFFGQSVPGSSVHPILAGGAGAAPSLPLGVPGERRDYFCAAERLKSPARQELLLTARDNEAVCSSCWLFSCCPSAVSTGSERVLPHLPLQAGSGSPLCSPGTSPGLGILTVAQAMRSLCSHHSLNASFHDPLDSSFVLKRPRITCLFFFPLMVTVECNSLAFSTGSFVCDWPGHAGKIPLMSALEWKEEENVSLLIYQFLFNPKDFKYYPF